MKLLVRQPIGRERDVAALRPERLVSLAQFRPVVQSERLVLEKNLIVPMRENRGGVRVAPCLPALFNAELEGGAVVLHGNQGVMLLFDRNAPPLRCFCWTDAVVKTEWRKL